VSVRTRGAGEERGLTYEDKFQGRVVVEDDGDHAQVSQDPRGSTWTGGGDVR
jgi:hypothetical protein